MPTISMFYGVVVSLYFLDNKRHHRPHIFMPDIKTRRPSLPYQTGNYWKELSRRVRCASFKHGSKSTGMS